MQNEIRLNRNATGWNARYIGPHAAEIVELFHTDTLPTCFTAHAESSVVQREIESLNPGILVTVEISSLIPNV